MAADWSFGQPADLSLSDLLTTSRKLRQQHVVFDASHGVQTNDSLLASIVKVCELSRQRVDCRACIGELTLNGGKVRKGFAVPVSV